MNNIKRPLPVHLLIDARINPEHYFGHPTFSLMNNAYSYKEIAFETSEHYEWCFNYPGEAIMQAHNKREQGEKVTKEIWKKLHHYERLFIREQNMAHDEENHPMYSLHKNR